MHFKEAFIAGLPLLIIGLIWIFKPKWILKLMMRPNASEKKIKVMTKIVQLLGIFAAIFAICAIINTLFFVK